MLQAQKAELAPATPDNRAGRPAQARTESSCGHSDSAHLQLHGTQLQPNQHSSPQADRSEGRVPETPYRQCPSSVAQHQSLDGNICTHQGVAVRQNCTGCRQWQRHCAKVQDQLEAHAAESARAMRAEVAALTQQLSEAQHEAANPAANLAHSQRTCMGMQCQLISLQTGPPLEQQHAIIPLGEYLNMTEGSLLCPEHIQAIDLDFSEAESGDSQDLPLAQQLRMAEGSGAASAGVTPAKPVFRQDARLHSAAPSVTDSDGSCLPARGCHGPADVDSMLQALEDVLQHASTPNPGAASLPACLLLRTLAECCNRPWQKIYRFLLAACVIVNKNATCASPCWMKGVHVGALEDASDIRGIDKYGRVSGGGTQLHSIREDIAAALKRRGELNAELACLHAKLAAVGADLADVQASQTPTEVLKLRQEIRRLRAVLPATSGETR